MLDRLGAVSAGLLGMQELEMRQGATRTVRGVKAGEVVAVLEGSVALNRVVLPQGVVDGWAQEEREATWEAAMEGGVRIVVA